MDFFVALAVTFLVMASLFAVLMVIDFRARRYGWVCAELALAAMLLWGAAAPFQNRVVQVTVRVP